MADPAIPMILHCPSCAERHIDEGDFATTKLHHTHSCQHCGTTWRPAIVNTVGVPFLPGFKNPIDNVLEQIAAERRRQDAQWGGPDHDDEHPIEQWIELAEQRLQAADALIGNPDDLEDPDSVWREYMLEAAAVCVAGIETLDRQKERDRRVLRKDGNLKEVGSCSDACSECGMNLNCKPSCRTQLYPIA